MLFTIHSYEKKKKGKSCDFVEGGQKINEDGVSIHLPVNFFHGTGLTLISPEYRH